MNLGAEWTLDGRTCSCCPTAAAVLPDGTVVVAYRDRDGEEVRDIAFVQGRPQDPASWSAPTTIFDDGWQILGCPVNGPALATNGNHLAAAWFTLGADGTPRVRVSLRTGDGPFGFPFRGDDGMPTGRVALAPVPGRQAFVLAWMEARSEAGEGAEWRARVIPLPPGSERGAGHASVTPGPSVVVAEVTTGRADGFLSLAAGGHDVYAAWTDARAATVRLARLRLD